MSTDIPKLPSIHDMLAALAPPQPSKPSPIEQVERWKIPEGYVVDSQGYLVRTNAPTARPIKTASRPLSPPDSPRSAISSPQSSIEWSASGSASSVPGLERGDLLPSRYASPPPLPVLLRHQPEQPTPSLLSLVRAAATVHAEQQPLHSRLRQSDDRHDDLSMQSRHTFAASHSRSSSTLSQPPQHSGHAGPAEHTVYSTAHAHQPALVAGPSRQPRPRTASRSSTPSTPITSLSPAARDMLKDTAEVIKYKDPSGRITTLQAKASTGKYGCTFCPKRFNRPSSLKIHLNTHTGSKPFQCPVPGCGRFFSVMSNMRRHQRNSHNSNEQLANFDDALEDGSVSIDDDEISQPPSPSAYNSPAPAHRKASPASSYHRPQEPSYQQFTSLSHEHRRS
ncbi:hypothetical protein BKA62DRAFT_680949 [Auriculariales sp. MPI-PUGE-AT-0066]|nr:hypothetical protein BKA62DRAFT_680949 [Auriculariales sp. MPI-PUGE-AT-0066]